jgi:serine/threonine-protein kinase
MSDQAASSGGPELRRLGDPTGATERPGGERIFAGRYRLLGRRGRATDLALFEAVDALTDRRVALKILHPDLCATPGFDERFVAAMHDAVRARHPNLTEVLDVGESTWGGRRVHFAVCENLTGGSLRDLRDRGRQLSPSQVVMIGLDACRGLDAAHRAGLVHGDIRPANLVFGDDGRLRITDLGFAALVGRAVDGDVSRADIEQAKYAAPEQAQGRSPGPKSDVYALCLCLLEAVTGQLPFVADSAVSTLAQRVDRLMPVSADLGPLAAVFERAGRPDPDDRSSAAEFGRALHQAAERLPRPAPLPLVGGALLSAPAPVAPTAPAPAPASTVPGEVPVPDDVAPAEEASAAEASGDTAAVGIAAVAIAAAEAGREIAAVSASGTESVDTAPVDTAPVDTDASSPTRAIRAVPILGPPVVAGPPVAPDTAAPSPDAVVPVAPAVADVPPPPQPEAVPPLLREPRSRRTLFAVVSVLLLALVVGGLLAVWFARDTSRAIPDLVGLEQGEALNTISEFDWEETVVLEASDDVPVGEVIRTDPAAGGRLDVGDAFTIVVSTGPAPRALPELVGLDVEQAKAALSELGLGLEIGAQPFDEVVPVGEVVSWTVPDQPGLVAGDTVLPGTAVVVVVSAGPAPRVVPDLTGLTPADAQATLEGLGLVAAPLPDEFSPTVSVGAIARQDPAPGTEVPRGATVSFAVSLGPDLVAVPPLADLGVDEARAALEAAGLVLGQVKGDPAGVNVLAEVNGVSIGADASFPRGTVVDLTFAVPAPPPVETTPTSAPPG